MDRKPRPLATLPGVDRLKGQDDLIEEGKKQNPGVRSELGFVVVVVFCERLLLSDLQPDESLPPPLLLD